MPRARLPPWLSAAPCCCATTGSALAVSLFLPALAWVAAQVDLPALRRVALAVAAVVLVRLLLNGYVLDYGVRPLAGGERVARGIRVAGRRFRPGRGDVPPAGR